MGGGGRGDGVKKESGSVNLGMGFSKMRDEVGGR